MCLRLAGRLGPCALSVSVAACMCLKKQEEEEVEEGDVEEGKVNLNGCLCCCFLVGGGCMRA